MSGSKVDPTRFTSTGPSASSYSSYQSRSNTQSANPSSFTSSRPLPTSHTTNSNAPPNETPKQKVERLRAQARAAKAAARHSPIDRIVDRGRVWADYAHRIVAVSLIGFSAVAGVFAAYSMVSLISHNRKQKRAWIERELERLHDAQRAFLAGTATPEQLHLLEQERAGEEMKQKREEELRIKKKNSLYGRAKAALLHTGSRDDAVVKKGTDLEALSRREEGEAPLSIREMAKGFRQAEHEAEEVFRSQESRGGELDVLADNATKAVQQSKDHGLLSWLRWR